MTFSSGLTCGKCLKNFFCRELLKAFRFFSFFSASFASLLVSVGGTSEDVSLEEDFCEDEPDLSLSLLLLAGEEEEGEWAFFDESLKEEEKVMMTLMRVQ